MANNERAAVVYSKPGEPEAAATIRIDENGRIALVVFRGGDAFKRIIDGADALATAGGMDALANEMRTAVDADWTPGDDWILSGAAPPDLWAALAKLGANWRTDYAESQPDADAGGESD